MEPRKIIATYARVSTARQEEEQTIKTQEVVLKDEAIKKGYNIVREYSDDGWSGDTLARPGLDQLRADVKVNGKNRLFDAVLVYDPDRLARRYSYQELIMDELREAGIEVMFITISAPKNSEDKILHGVRGLFAEYERAKITERFRLGKIRKVKEGHLLVSQPLYGYNYVPKNENKHGYYIINEEEARIVRMIFSWVADEGKNIRQVVLRLQELDIKPRKSKRGVWSTSTISNLLKNKTFIGKARWGSTYAIVPLNPFSNEKYRRNKKTSRKFRPEEEWYIISVPAIVDESLFERVRTQLEINSTLSRRSTKNEYLLAKKIWCTCGNRRSGESRHDGKNLYYRCNGRILNFPLPSNCNAKGISVKIADDLVWESVATLMSSPELMFEQIKRWFNNRINKAEVTVCDTDILNKEVEKLKIEEDRYNKAYGVGVFTVEKLNEYTLPILERIKKLNSQITKIEHEKDKMSETSFPDENQIKTFALTSQKKLRDLNFQLKRAIVLNVVEKVIGVKEKIRVNGNIPIPINSNVALYTNDMDGLNTSQLSSSGGYKLVPFEINIELPL